MAFNATLPQTNAPITSAELRAQFTGLKTLIDAVPTSPNMASAITNQVAADLVGVTPLSLSISNPPTQAQVTAILDRLNLLITRLASGI
jgi:hypothetical protein